MIAVFIRALRSNTTAIFFCRESTVSDRNREHCLSFEKKNRPAGVDVCESVLRIKLTFVRSVDESSSGNGRRSFSCYRSPVFQMRKDNSLSERSFLERCRQSLRSVHGGKPPKHTRKRFPHLSFVIVKDTLTSAAVDLDTANHMPSWVCMHETTLTLGGNQQPKAWSELAADHLQRVQGGRFETAKRSEQFHVRATPWCFEDTRTFDPLKFRFVFHALLANDKTFAIVRGKENWQKKHVPGLGTITKSILEKGKAFFKNNHSRLRLRNEIQKNRKLKTPVFVLLSSSVFEEHDVSLRAVGLFEGHADWSSLVKRQERAKVCANDAVPRRFVRLVEMLFDVLGNLVVNGVFLQRLLRHVDRFLLHRSWHVRAFNNRLLAVDQILVKFRQFGGRPCVLILLLLNVLAPRRRHLHRRQWHRSANADERRLLLVGGPKACADRSFRFARLALRGLDRALRLSLSWARSTGFALCRLGFSCPSAFTRSWGSHDFWEETVSGTIFGYQLHKGTGLSEVRRTDSASSSVDVAQSEFCGCHGSDFSFPQTQHFKRAGLCACASNHVHMPHTSTNSWWDCGAAFRDPCVNWMLTENRIYVNCCSFG